MPKAIELKIPVPGKVSRKAAKRAEATARQAAIIGLQQEGSLTFREAAGELGLGYEEYLNLLARLGYPISYGEGDPALIRKLFKRPRK